MRKPKKIEESKSILLPMKERKALGARRERDKIACPECGSEALRSPSNGKWYCTAADDVPTHVDEKGKVHTISVLNCTARGATLPDGSLVTTQQHKRDANPSL